MDYSVVIVEYDPQWPALYEKERELVCKVLGDKISAIEHVGSTAVPNVCGKSIIDIMAGVSEFDEANECCARLARPSIFSA